MEFPAPDVYENFKDWGRQLISQLKRIPTTHATDEKGKSPITDSVDGYQGTWTDTHALFAVKFWKDPHGWVMFSGSCTNVGAPLPGQTIFTLPEGYRPAQLLISFYLPPLTQIYIWSDGRVVYAGGSKTSIGLAQIRFRETSAYWASQKA